MSSGDNMDALVLIIDDSNFNIESLRMMLKKMKIASNSAINGIEGFRQV